MAFSFFLKSLQIPQRFAKKTASNFGLTGSVEKNALKTILCLRWQVLLHKGKTTIKVNIKKEQWSIIFHFFNCNLVVPRPTLNHYRGDSLTAIITLITAFLQFQLGHREPRNEVGSLSLAEYLMGFELGTFRL